MNIATTVTDDDHLLVERGMEPCQNVRFQARETFSIYRDGVLCERLSGTKAMALNRIAALSNCDPEHDWDVDFTASKSCVASWRVRNAARLR